jgi:hypothetical protein
MWIYQEVFLASNMKMLFGAQAANMQALQDVIKVCSSLMMSYRPQSECDHKNAQLELNEMLRSHDLLVKAGHESDLSALRLLVHQLQPRDRTGKAIDFGNVDGIVQVQEAIQGLQCQDPRDKASRLLVCLDLLAPFSQIMGYRVSSWRGASCASTLPVTTIGEARNSLGPCVTTWIWISQRLMLRQSSNVAEDNIIRLPSNAQWYRTDDSAFTSSRSSYSEHAINGKTIVVNDRPVANSRLRIYHRRLDRYP